MPNIVNALENVEFINDVNSNGKYDVGDEIAIKGEHFYVIKNDGVTITSPITLSNSYKNYDYKHKFFQ